MTKCQLPAADGNTVVPLATVLQPPGSLLEASSQPLEWGLRECSYGSASKGSPHCSLFPLKSIKSIEGTEWYGGRLESEAAGSVSPK